MIIKGALAEYSQVEMLLGALPRDWGAELVMILELDPRDPLAFKYDKLQKHVLDTCVTSDALAHLKLEGGHMTLGVSPYSVRAGVPLPLMPDVVNLLAIPNKETPALAEATEEIPIAEAENTMDTKMDNIMKAFEA